MVLFFSPHGAPEKRKKDAQGAQDCRYCERYAYTLQKQVVIGSGYFFATDIQRQDNHGDGHAGRGMAL